MIGFLILIGSFLGNPLILGSMEEIVEPVSIIHFFNEKTRTYDIYCENTAPDIYTIELDFEILQGLYPSTPYPLRKTIPPGRHLIMKLTQHDLSSRGHFKVELTYRRGSLTYDIEENFPYLFPLKQGSFAKPLCCNNIRALYSHQTDTSFFVTAFKAMAGDTIYAARRGVVSKIQNHIPTIHFDSPDIANYLDIQHTDGTYARYEGLKENYELALLGQTIEAGDPIAIARSEPKMDSTFFTFRTFYYSEKVITCKVGPSNIKTTTVPIRFYGVPEIDTLSCKKTYKVIHPEEIILQEMNRRDIRRWSKRKREKPGIIKLLKKE